MNKWVKRERERGEKEKIQAKEMKNDNYNRDGESKEKGMESIMREAFPLCTVIESRCSR